MSDTVTRLGVDWGNKTMGLALGLPGQKAMPLAGVDKSLVVNQIIKAINDYDVGEIVVGVSEGENKDTIINWTKSIGEKTKLKVVFCDEFASSLEVRGIWHAADRKMRGLNKSEHGLAACEILDRYLRK